MARSDSVQRRKSPDAVIDSPSSDSTNNVDEILRLLYLSSANRERELRADACHSALRVRGRGGSCCGCAEEAAEAAAALEGGSEDDADPPPAAAADAEPESIRGGPPTSGLNSREPCRARRSRAQQSRAGLRDLDDSPKKPSWGMGQSAQSSGPTRKREAGRESGRREWGQAGATSRTSRTQWGSG